MSPLLLLTVTVLALAALAWFWLRRRAGPPATGYQGQFGQDRYLDEELFKGRRDGVFVEIGSADPVLLSNTWFLETQRGWRGLLIEARESACRRLRRMRRSEVVHACVGASAGRGVFLDFGFLAGLAASLGPAEHALIAKQSGHERRVNAYWVDITPLSAILAARGLRRIDLLCIDTEGAELDILGTLDFSAVEIGAILCESNSAERSAAVAALLAPHGYALERRLGADDLFVNRRHLPA